VNSCLVSLVDSLSNLTLSLSGALSSSLCRLSFVNMGNMCSSLDPSPESTSLSSIDNGSDEKRDVKGEEEIRVCHVAAVVDEKEDAMLAFSAVLQINVVH
jgi:hypothetical protein